MVRWLVHSVTNSSEPNLHTLFDAIADRRMERLRELLSEGVNVNVPWAGKTSWLSIPTFGHPAIVPWGLNENGTTALHMAARFGNAEIVSLLLNANANVDARDRWTCTALIYAARKGRTGVVKALLMADLNVDVQDEYKNAALTFAAEQGYTDIVRLLLEA